jgi:hypothetical protein
VVCGTRYPFSRAQRERGMEILRVLRPTTVNHGGCTGADEVLALAAAELEPIPTLVGWPEIDVPDWFRSKLAPADFWEPALPALERNQAMVDASTTTLALPSEMDPSARSGTWSTIRRAIKAGHRLILVVGPRGQLWRRGSL